MWTCEAFFLARTPLLALPPPRASVSPAAGCFPKHPTCSQGPAVLAAPRGLSCSAGVNRLARSRPDERGNVRRGAGFPGSDPTCPLFPQIAVVFCRQSAGERRPKNERTPPGCTAGFSLSRLVLHHAAVHASASSLRHPLSLPQALLMDPHLADILAKEAVHDPVHCA